MKARLLSVTYEPSNSVEVQDSYEKTKRYTQKGYYIKISRNGYYLLVKPVRVWVIVGNKTIKQTFNLKREICDYYGKTRISFKLLERFQKEAEEGKILFELDSDNSCKIISAWYKKEIAYLFLSKLSFFI